MGEGETIDGTSADEYLEDKAVTVKWELEERWKLYGHRHKAVRGILQRTGEGAALAREMLDCERAAGEFYGALDVAHAMGFLIDWDEGRENIVGVRVDPCLAKTLGGE